MSHSINRIFHLRNCFFYDESRFTGILKKFKLVSLGGVDKVADLKTGRYMATKQVAVLVITNAHEETDHGGEKTTLKHLEAKLSP